MITTKHSNRPWIGLTALCAPLLALTACADAGSAYGSKDEGAGSASLSGGDEGQAEGGNEEGLGVGQGGSQDFGEFKQILEDGQIPGPGTLDDVGFFNEHKLVLPTPACTNDVCLHGLFGQMGNMITGSDCITVLVGMNTAIDISKLERPPLNLALVIDTSGSMQGEAIAYVREGLMRMLDGLEAKDSISLVTFSGTAHLQVEAVTGDAPELINAIDAIAANGGTNIYDGLRTGFEVVDAHRIEGAQNRVVFLSDGMATDGITNNAKIISMAAGFAAAGYGLTTIGVGTTFDADLMRSLSEQASGNFYFLQDPAAVQEVFHEEVTSFLVPLAEDVSIDVDIGDAYVLRGIYGTKLFDIAAGSGSIEIPNLQLAHRTGVDDHDDGGRRGGGGAILLELLRKQGQDATQAVGDLKLHYRVPNTDTYVDEQVAIKIPVAPDQVDLEKGTFEDVSVQKGFVMLNIFTGFQMAATRPAQGDLTGAYHVLDGLEKNVAAWLVTTPDFDIEDDLKYIRLFQQNLLNAGAAETPPTQPGQEPPPPSEPWPND
jgi:Ca-activated chloride channel family protein